MTSHFRLPPLLLPLCHFVIGIGAAGSFGLYLPPHLLYLTSLLALSCLFPLTRNLFRAVLCLSLLAAGNLMIQPLLEQGKVFKQLLDLRQQNRLTIEGVIVARPEAKDGGRRIILKPSEIMTEEHQQITPDSGQILLRISTGGSSFATGDRIRFVGRLKPPRNFGLPFEFDSERFYALKNIAATTFVKSDAEVLLVKPGEGSGLQRYFDLQSADIGRFIMSRYPSVEGGILKALLIGDISDISQEVRNQYSRTGVNHILSISGFHIGIIALALFQLWSAVARIFPSLLLRINFRRFALFVSIPLIVYYMFLSGAAPATARSVIMLCFLAVALLLEKETDPINTLCLAAFSLLLINPAYLYDISFQLSFISLWGLTILTPILARPLAGLSNRWTRNLFLFAVASVAAVTVTLLPVAYYFQQCSLTGIISNFFIVPLLGYGAVVTGIIAISCIHISPIVAGVLFYLAAALTKLSNVIIAALDTIPLLPTFFPTETEIGLFLAALLLITVTRNFQARSTVLVAAPLFIFMSHQITTAGKDPTFRIDFLSVGQGESSLITFTDGRRMLIDGGGALYESGWDIGRQLLLPTLKKMGVRKIDYLVLTHSHPDHLQGVKAAAEDLEIGEFWESGLNSGTEYDKLIALLRARRIPVRILSTGSSPMEFSGTRISCLHPVASALASGNMNENSLTLRFETGEFSVLFTGDIGFEAEAEILHHRGVIRSTVLKVPHHGSSYSTGPDFLDAVSPEIALISAGYANSFGLPARDTLDQLSAKRIRIFRTDLDGTVTITVKSSGKAPTVSTLKGKSIDSATNVLYF